MKSTGDEVSEVIAYLIILFVILLAIKLVF